MTEFLKFRVRLPILKRQKALVRLILPKRFSTAASIAKDGLADYCSAAGSCVLGGFTFNLCIRKISASLLSISSICSEVYLPFLTTGGGKCTTLRLSKRNWILSRSFFSWELTIRL